MGALSRSALGAREAGATDLLVSPVGSDKEQARTLAFLGDLAGARARSV
ncbi:hypothetical protein ACFY05_07945 [Microtetraspora fusca]|uniref:LLM class flavin-dependent oxidoreductase n=1 Tax=Microtetraspora fusca TaxID=1997 RepID=A0ABW6V1H3_MICFU